MIQLRGVSKSYHLMGNDIPVLSGIEISIDAGEMVALTGPSGSGKSTLLNILGCLDTADSGEYHLDGRSISGLDEPELAIIRNRLIGFVFQSFQLLPRATALANVCQPLVYRGTSRRTREAAAGAALSRVGLADRIDHRPNELSGGQRQRVAIARALVGSPRLLLADEPTGNLDSTTSNQIMDILASLNRAGLTIVLVTHEPEIAARCERQIRLRDGTICS